jgi:hypothetical protein
MGLQTWRGRKDSAGLQLLVHEALHKDSADLELLVYEALSY